MEANGMTMEPIPKTLQYRVPSFVQEANRRIVEAGLERRPETLPCSDPGYVIYKGSRVMDLCSNDYLGLSRHPALIEAFCKAAEQTACGAGASRLMSGSRPVHDKLEEATALLKNHESAMLFGCGYLANTGVIPVLCGRKDAIFSDRLNHASIIDGIRLSGSRHFRYRHLDINHLEELLKQERENFDGALIITESLFSMDGDCADVEALVEIARRYNCMLMVDEAHATGIFGTQGEGLVPQDIAPEVDVITGTYGKALGGYGAYAVMAEPLKRVLTSRCRTFIFSTALPPPVAAAAMEGIKIVTEEVERRNHLIETAHWFRKILRERCGIETCSTSQIIPVPCGENSRAISLQEELLRAGFFTRAIRPPTVPAGTARIRLSITVHHHRSELERLVETVRQHI